LFSVIVRDRFLLRIRIGGRIFQGLSRCVRWRGVLPAVGVQEFEGCTAGS
jgi:hypothetical protein